MRLFWRTFVLTLATLAIQQGRAWACSPADVQGSAGDILWPTKNVVLPAGDVRLWFFERHNPTFRLAKLGHYPEPLTLTQTMEFSQDGVLFSPTEMSQGLAYADVRLEADAQYYLDLGVGAQLGSTVGHRLTTEVAPWVQADLSNVDPLLVFVRTSEIPNQNTNCLLTTYNEVTILFIRRPEGAAFVLARPKYPSPAPVSPTVAQFIDPSMEDIKFTFWNTDQGPPTCVELEAYGPDGSMQDQRTVCELDHCQGGDSIEALFPRSHWDTAGQGNSCGSSGCLCVATPATPSGLLLLLLGFIGLRRERRCSRRA